MKYVNVKRYKRGAQWPDGSVRTCTRCRVEKNRELRRRANQADVVADLVDGRYRVPVGYCTKVRGHLPDELQEGTS